MGVDEPVAVVGYDPGWPLAFDRERRRVGEALGDAVVAIEHFGSTAVPGMAAKPIVDILVGLRVSELREKQMTALVRLGYEYLGEAGVSGRLAFRKRGPTAYNIAAVGWNGRLWQDSLLLRNFLRANPEEARRYGRRKQQLVSQGVSTLLKYSERKEASIQELLRSARARPNGSPP